MADTKISALAPAAALAGGEAVPLVQGGATVRAAPAAFAAFARANRVEQVAFSAVVPLDGAKLMAQAVVSGPFAFAAPASPVAGASCYVRLVADGANVPTFPAAFAEHGSSAGYLNLAGAVNLVDFWYDGTIAYYAVNQAADVAPFAASGAYVPAAQPATVVLAYPHALNGQSVPAATAFAVDASGGAATVAAVAVGEQAVTLTLARAIAGGETVRVTYQPPGASPLLDTSGNAVVTSATSARNGVLPAGQRYLRFANLVNQTETADPLGGYDYTPTAAAAGYQDASARGVASGAIPAGQDGFFLFRAQGSAAAGAGKGLLFGLSASAAIGGYTDIAYALYTDSPTSYSAPVTAGTPGQTILYQPGDWLRFRRTGSSILCELSQDDTTSWTTLYGWSDVSAAALYPAFCVADATIGPAALFFRPIGSANVA